MRIKLPLLTIVIALVMLADAAGVNAQRRRRDPPGVKNFDEGDIVVANPDSMRQLQTQYRLADTRIMDYMRESMLAVQQGHRNGLQHFAVWYRNREKAKETSTDEILKTVFKQVLTKGLDFAFPEATPFIETMKSIADVSADVGLKALALPSPDVNLFLEKLRTAEEEHIRRLLDTPQQFRKDHAPELQAAKMAYLDAWMQDETAGSQGQELPAPVRTMIDALGVPSPGAATAQTVAEGVLTAHIYTILMNDEGFRIVWPYSNWDAALVEALNQMDKAANKARVCKIERAWSFFRTYPTKECNAL